MSELAVIAKVLDNHFNGERMPGEPRKTGFILMVFPFDDSADTLCVSNCANRAQVVQMCRATIAALTRGDA